MSRLRIAALIVLGVDIAASTVYMLLLVLAFGAWSWLHRQPLDLAFDVAVVWVATVAGAATLIWMIWSGRRFWSRFGAIANVLWAAFALAIGIVGYPLLSPYAILGLVASILLLVVAFQERTRPAS